MARWPWVSRGMHLEVIAAKNEVIYNQQRHIASLEEQLKNPAPVKVKVEMPTIQVPSGVPSRRRMNPGVEPKNEPIDWANVNENDNEALARIAAQELGGPTTPYILSRTISRIKFNITEAKRAKVKKLISDAADRAGLSPETPRTETEAVEQGPDYVPAHILNMIEEAERV